MPRLVLFLAAFVVFRGSAEAQSDEKPDYFNGHGFAADGDPGTAESNKNNLKIKDEIGYGNFIRAETEPQVRYKSDLTAYFGSGADPEKYMASININELLWPARQDAGRGGTGGLIMIGLKKPYYRISGAPFIKGKLDFQLAGSLFGVENKGLITLSYYVSTAYRLQELSSSISFEQISFALYIPFGKSHKH